MRMTDPNRIRNFILAGNAIFTLVSTKTGNRFTYRVASAKSCHFVRVRTSTDIYAFLGALKSNLIYVHAIHKSRIAQSAPCVIAFRWFIHHLLKNNLPTTLEFWHEGKCGKCGRTLTVPESIAIGLGPTCLARDCGPNKEELYATSF